MQLSILAADAEAFPGYRTVFNYRRHGSLGRYRLAKAKRTDHSAISHAQVLSDAG
jgi:hypothetical protein